MALAMVELRLCLHGATSAIPSGRGRSCLCQSSQSPSRVGRTARIHSRRTSSDFCSEVKPTSRFLGSISGLGFRDLREDGPTTTASAAADGGVFVVRAVLDSAAPEKPKPKQRYPGESKGFVEEMRFVAMKLHTKDQAKEGEKQADVQPVAKWEPTITGYIRFLVDSKKVYDTLESIVAKATHPSCIFLHHLCSFRLQCHMPCKLTWRMKSRSTKMPWSGHQV